MKPYELDRILADHKQWLTRDGGNCADLHKVDLSWTDLAQVDLREADLRKVDLSGSNMSGVDLTGANLSGAYMTGVDLSWANLTGANLTGTDLAGANLRGADLSGADLSGADLSGATLQGARGILWAQCSWASHGPSGRMLTAVRIGDETVCYCGCFHGSPADLREYIATHKTKYAASRTIAADFVLSRVDEMISSRSAAVQPISHPEVSEA